MNTSKIDGLDGFKNLFKSNDDFVNHIISNSLFFDKTVVVRQAREVQLKIKTGESIPVRYTSSAHFFQKHAVKTTTPSFKNKSEAVKFTKSKENHIFHKDTKIRICFDSDGNSHPKDIISQHTGHKVSSGKQSTVTNFVISHIWGNTNNPLYFSLLWNFCLIPEHCSFLTDKRADSDPIISRIQQLLKAISIELYDPNKIMDQEHDVIGISDMPTKEFREEARKLIAEGKIKFMPNTSKEVVMK